MEVESRCRVRGSSGFPVSNRFTIFGRDARFLNLVSWVVALFSLVFSAVWLNSCESRQSSSSKQMEIVAT